MVKYMTGNLSAWLLRGEPPSLTLGKKPEVRAGHWAGGPEILNLDFDSHQHTASALSQLCIHPACLSDTQLFQGRGPQHSASKRT